MSIHPQGTQLSILDLTKAFGKKTVLNSINLEVSPGEFVAIVGRSGCGKSTLLRLVSGLEKASAGGILLDGEPLRKLSSSVRVMFQDPRLLEWKRVIQNVGLGLQNNWREKAQWALEQVGLDDRGEEWPSVLSGGQRQRVSLARALVSQPRLLLLDEPLGALDALTRIDMQKLIEKLWQEQQFTAFLVTHDVEEAVALADRVILIEDGRIALDLPVNLPRPRDRGNEVFVSIRETILDQVMNREGSYAYKELLQLGSY
ncbi:ATP-binding cassette domain-containing protein [Nostoc sp. FACHB-87]|uniref:ATP-binding cassette domain-containing protein n=1 Tax=Nostocales TaxID=1161 RepID=UPI001688957A|nr:MULTISPECIES: ATP-binding cassette domain-containing protein [Nostocales]MBD2298731.1 ATP-binding cassette domain-containing protein [Nostoc sp. FACHB-190]MBD2454501.1 ATP-binding cassette domain-containing protein [Nostoc sp. FACHB-87]MBD2474313.1 ATP-binding cassette domain-containing protein [Anabaena sp. FACHB-83]MBD2487141.1 ATP-binding cassette domain-containing protein [Aulosira sp. FACHB-615]